MMQTDVKKWRERAKQPFSNRREMLQHIASGPDDRLDVQAARRLLNKARYLCPVTETTEARDLFNLPA